MPVHGFPGAILAPDDQRGADTGRRALHSFAVPGRSVQPTTLRCLPGGLAVTMCDQRVACPTQTDPLRSVRNRRSSARASRRRPRPPGVRWWRNIGMRDTPSRPAAARNAAEPSAHRSRAAVARMPVWVLAWSLCGLCVVLTGAGLVFFAITYATPVPVSIGTRETGVVN